MTITPEQQAIIDEELKVLAEVSESLRKQASYAAGKFESEQDKSRELNSSIVASHRAEEKAMLASDEAVAHALSIKKKGDLKDIQKLLKRPYFGRVIVEEERPQGTKTIEYKLGLFANPDCRIIDWRSAPISKLYYEYREGDDYEEIILGQERVGRVLQRRTVEIEHGVLRSIICPQGTFEKKGSEWIVHAGGMRTTKAGASSTLADVLPLVTAEQFRMITEDADTAILIQGVAGSGKTTVALHRLAWLLKERAESMNAEDVLIILFSKPLQRYIQSLLPSLELENISVLGYSEWASKICRTALPEFIDLDLDLPRRPTNPVPTRIFRVKRTMAVLDVLEETIAHEKADFIDKITRLFSEQEVPTGILKSWHEVAKKPLALFLLIEEILTVLTRAQETISASHPRFASLKLVLEQIDQMRKELPAITDIYVKALSNFEAILSNDDSKLLNRELLKDTHAITVAHLSEKMIDGADESLLLRAIQARHGHLPHPLLSRSIPFKHIIADEVQDYTPAQLATIVSAVEHPGQLTLVGDVAQSIHDQGAFPGWEKLKQRWKLKDSISRSISLTVSFRSTLPIMRLADRVHDRTLVTSGRDGRVPIWFRSETEELGIEAVLKWLEKAVELYTTEMSAVLCASPQEARQVLSLLKPRFGHSVRLGDDTNFSFEEGIVVTTTQLVKGLEFANVLLWNPSRETYPNNEIGRNLLYVAITRAIENLSVVSWNRPTDLLPPERERLMRYVELQKPEEEEEVDEDPYATVRSRASGEDRD
jgi:DNA helicase-2/ATP-dependent DNA helicase PcrA